MTRRIHLMCLEGACPRAGILPDVCGSRKLAASTWTDNASPAGRHAKIKRLPLGSGTESPHSLAVSIHRRIASCELARASS
jgi:hypothetical protein